MCLSTVYGKHGQEEERVICNNVSMIRVEDKNVRLTDVLGCDMVVPGALVSADLTQGVVVLELFES